MSSYIDILKTDSFQSMLKNEKYSKQINSENSTLNTKKLSLEDDSKIEEKNKEIWSTEYILSIYKNISEN